MADNQTPTPSLDNLTRQFDGDDPTWAISVTERQRFILRVRTLARSVAQAYFDARAALGRRVDVVVFPTVGGTN